MPTVYGASQHAVERFMERANASDPQAAYETIIKMARAALPYDRKSNKWYSCGWVFVLKNKCVLTCYRQTTKTGWKKFKRDKRVDSM